MPNKNYQFAFDLINNIDKQLIDISIKRTKEVECKLQKILDVFREERLSASHFISSTGYGYNNIAREKIDIIFSKVFNTEKAAVRSQFVSGTHAIAACLFGVLRPGDEFLSVTGSPYDSLEEVIGINNKGQGSLKDFGINFEKINFDSDKEIYLQNINNALKKSYKLVFIQKSCGYSWRQSLSNSLIGEICELVHKKKPDSICFVDNCYGEFVENNEPPSVGADLIAGSLVKNPGGTIVPNGGYIAGKAELVEMACCRLNSPGIGSSAGSGFNLERLFLQGLFLAPQMVSEALIGADLVAATFQKLGYEVNPTPLSYRSDIIQAVRIGNPIIIEKICEAFQRSSPVDSFLKPVPSYMNGYQDELLMSGGTFIEGSTSEFSADAPLREPFDLFIQGGTHRSHVKISLVEALVALIENNLLEINNIHL
tara:strand:- start:32818 stop:34095 length:1278 start_codon:yes stop_codon:yes gene_type:complete